MNHGIARAVELLQPLVSAEDFSSLCALLGNAIEHGASMGFMKPLDHSAISNFWRKVIAELQGANRLIWIAREKDTGEVIGSAQLCIETRANGRHRAEVQKLMVLKRCRGNGIATRLMQAVEQSAKERGLTLLFLDTSVGRGGACAFYERLGYTHCGGIPNYALDPDGTPASNAIYYKNI